MQSKNKDWFHFNGYNWSRVLLRAGGDYRFEVKVALTSLDQTNIKLREVLIAHTHLSEVMVHEKEIWTHELPEAVYAQLQEQYSRDRLNTLLHADLYPMIDWDRHRKANNYWVPLADCIKQASVLYTDITIGMDGNKELFLSEEQWFKKFGIELREGIQSVGGFHYANGQCDLLAYISYEMMTGKVVLDIRSSNPDQDSIVRFQQHRSKDWSHEFNLSINKMAWANEECEFYVLDLKEMIRRASIYISSFNQ